jgi:putative spermidine/putrescine transport system permease protein
VDQPVESRDQSVALALIPGTRPVARRFSARAEAMPLWLLLAPATLFLLVYFFAPLGLLSWWSLRAPGVAGPTTANFQSLLGDRFFLETLWLSLRLSLEVTAITLVLGFPLAYCYARAGTAVKLSILFVTLLPLLTSAVVRSFGWIVLLGKQGLVNQLLVAGGLVETPVKLLFTTEGVRIALAQVQLPFMLLPLINALEQLDASLEQAAMSLGASRARAFLSVTVPLSMPGVIAGAILTFTLTISAFITPAIVGGGSFIVIPTLIYQAAVVTLQWNTAAAVSLILLVVALGVVWAGTGLARRSSHRAARA